MAGLVEEFGCDAILCPSGTYNILGRAFTADNMCVPCNDGNSFLGATTCEEPVPEAEGVDEWEVLLKFYEETAGEKWTVRDGWEVFDDIGAGGCLGELQEFGLDVCDGWYGVLCDNEGNITDIALPNNELFGTIPHVIFSLPSLETVDISNNNVLLSMELEN